MKKTSAVNRMMYVSLSLTVLLIAARICYTKQWYHISLAWNLFLAFIPFYISNILIAQKPPVKLIQYLLLLLWLIFFPNAPYIITDFVHLDHRPPVPFWYDLIIMFWASWNGLLLGFVSLLNIENFLLKRFSKKVVNIWVYAFMILCAFGVYAGRYLRWNSWDVVVNPGDILKDVKHIVLNPEDNMRTWGVTIIFSLLMITCYFTIKNLRQTAHDVS